MDYRFEASRKEVSTFTNQEIRDNFLISTIFQADEIKLKLGEEKFAEVYEKINSISRWFDEMEDNNSDNVRITQEIYDIKYKELEDYLVPIFKSIMN